MYEVVVVVAGVGDGCALMAGAVTIGADEDEDVARVGDGRTLMTGAVTIGADEDEESHGPLWHPLPQ